MPTLDVLTVDEAKLAINNNAGANNDSLLGSYVTAVSQFMDKRFGPVVQRAVTNEQHRGVIGPRLALYEPPVASITSCTEYIGKVARTITVAATPDVTGTYGATLDPEQGILVRWASGSIQQWASVVYVTYQAGRFAATSSVDDRFKRAAGIILANIWRPEHGLNGTNPADHLGPTYALPHAAEGLLTGESVGTFA